MKPSVYQVKILQRMAAGEDLIRKRFGPPSKHIRFRRDRARAINPNSVLRLVREKFIEELAMPTEIRYFLNAKGREAAVQDEKG
jgi:hypothetical protein